MIKRLKSNYSTTTINSSQRPNVINISEDKFESVLSLPNCVDRKGEGGLRNSGYFKHSYKNVDGNWWSIDRFGNKIEKVILPDEISGYDNLPLVTIVTVVFNGEKYLESTIKSVLGQTYPNIEYIIIDGGSTDGTLDIIKNYEDGIDYWVSEPDKGISDAFNKGIKASSGFLIGMINSGDWYEEKTCEIVCQSINKDGDVIYGNEFYWQDEQVYLYKSDHRSLIKRMSIAHPVVFVKKHVYKRFGLFDLNLKNAMDYDLMLRLYVNNVNFVHVDEVFANMISGGVSNVNWRNTATEVYLIRKKYLGFKVIYLAKLVFVLMKKTVGSFLSSIGLKYIRVLNKRLSKNIKKVKVE